MSFSQRPAMLLPSITTAALLVALTACGDSGPGEGEPSQAPSHEPSASATPETEETEENNDDGDLTGYNEFDDSALGQMNDTVLELINSEDSTSEDDWEPLLDETFTEELSPEEFTEIINTQIQPGGPWELDEFIPTGEYSSASVIRSDSGHMGMELSLDEDTELINGLFFGALAQED